MNLREDWRRYKVSTSLRPRTRNIALSRFFQLNYLRRNNERCGGKKKKKQKRRKGK